MKNLILPAFMILSSNIGLAQQQVKIIDGNGGLEAAAVVSKRLQVDINGGGITVSASSPVNAAGNFANSNTVISTAATTFTKPANAVGFELMAPSTNTASIRWAVGSAATTSSGILMESGRDTGYIPLSANISAISINGTQTVSVQWILSQ
jgi:hypothetical protein